MDSVIKPADATHETRFGDAGATIFSLQISDSLFGAAGYRWVRGGELSRRMLAAYRHLSEGSAADIEENETWEALVSSALACASAPAPERDRPWWLSEAEEALRDAAAHGGDVAGAAKRVGVHPVHLARQFKRHTGCGAAEFVRRLRAQRAAHLLATTRRDAADVALASGFCDQGHMCRVMKSEWGVSPGSYRSLVRG